MTTKLGRNYRLSMQTPDNGLLTANQLLVIEPPFTLEMDITRHTLGSANVCQIRLYNLAEKTRNLIHFNGFNQSLFNTINLEAGYGDQLATVFNGNVSRAWSVREGVNFITQIECYDGGFALVNGQVNISFPAGTPVKVVIATLMAALPNITIGAIGNFDSVLLRGNTYAGNPAEILNEITGGAFYIDAGKAYALKNNEYNALIPVTVIDDSTGLLNTPILEETMARFEMIFEPTLNVGSLVLLATTTFPLLNGTYSITGVKHRGIISPVVSGDLITTGEFFYSQVPIPVEGAL